MKKPSRKADLAIYDYSVVVSGYTSVAIKLVNKRDSNSCAYIVDFLKLSNICQTRSKREQLLKINKLKSDVHLLYCSQSLTIAIVNSSRDFELNLLYVVSIMKIV